VGVRRYGFHGLSYESIVDALAQEGSLPKRLVVAHLGGGSSVCAIADGRSLDTTMGLTPTGGIPSATRTGDLDPGVMLYLLRAGGLSVDELEQLVNHAGGLAGIASGSGDMQELERAAAGGDAETAVSARLAIEIFADAVARTVASYAVALGGLDMLVFTGGIGEHSASLRTAVTSRLEPLQVCSKQPHDGLAPVRALPAAEERMIALHVRELSHEQANPR
jgi:acetate kinase